MRNEADVVVVEAFGQELVKLAWVAPTLKGLLKSSLRKSSSFKKGLSSLGGGKMPNPTRKGIPTPDLKYRPDPEGPMARLKKIGLGVKRPLR